MSNSFFDKVEYYKQPQKKINAITWLRDIKHLKKSY